MKAGECSFEDYDGTEKEADEASFIIECGKV
jgi:hypothetical protein